MNVASWKRTDDLRWREMQEYAGIAYALILEQCWICLETGERDWRPVPTLTTADQEP